MKRRTNRSTRFLYLSALFAMAIATSNTNAQEVVDVYIVTGQSNAANFAQRAGTGGTDVGYNLTFARDRTVFTDPTHTDQSFSSSSLDTSQAVTLLSQGLFQSNDQAIFGFARPGTALTNLESPNWFPGADPANGQVNDAGYYGDFVDWMDARIDEIEAAGNIPIVKGLFWFQGERDAVQGLASVDAYETNFRNLAYRFREHFGNNLPIVVAEIREGVAQNAALRADVNAALYNVAAGDPKMTVIPTQNLSWVSANDVHLNTAGYQALAPIWATAMNLLQAPGSTILQYDSVSNGDGTSTMRELDFLTDSDFVASADDLIALGANTTDTGQHASQQQTVTLGGGTDKFFQFGGDTEMLMGSLEDAVLDDGEWIGASFTAADDITIDSLSVDLFVNNANATSWAARDVGLFLRTGNTGSFTPYGAVIEGVNGDNGTVVFDDSFSVSTGEEVQWRLAFTNRTNVEVAFPATRSTRVGSIRLNAFPTVPFVAGTVNAVSVSHHNHISDNFTSAELESVGAAPSAGTPSVTESPFFALANPSGGLSGDLGFNNNPNADAPTAPATAATTTVSGTITIVGDSTATGGFADGNRLPAGVTATYDISFDLSTTTGALLSAGVAEANGLGAGNGDAFFTPSNGNFSGNLVFGAATISGVSFAGSPTDAGYVFANGSINSIDLVGLRSASFTGSNDAILTDAAGGTVVEFTTNGSASGEILINDTNNNLFEGQPLGDAILAVINGGMHLKGFTLGTNFSYDISEIPSSLTGDFDGDDDVDINDINFYVGNIGSAAESELAQLDLNSDGQVTLADLEIHVTTYVQTSNGQTGTFLGDLNLDGTVNVLGDAFALIGNLGNAATSYAQGDLNLDGTVNVLGDAFVLIGNLGNTNAP